jgi:hypothetical protein
MGFRGSEVQTQDEKVHDNRHKDQGGKVSHTQREKLLLERRKLIASLPLRNFCLLCPTFLYMEGVFLCPVFGGHLSCPFLAKCSANACDALFALGLPNDLCIFAIVREQC